MKPYEHGGQVYRWQKKYMLEDSDIIDFSANINPLGPPRRMIDVIRKETEKLPNYPEPDAAFLCGKIAGEHGVKYENVIAGNGASELIDLFFLYLRPQKVLFPAPTFKEYERVSRAVNSDIYSYYTGDMPLSDHLEDFVANIKNVSPDVVVICTPNNPTGEVLERDHLIKIAEAAREVGGWVLLDKSFMPFVCGDWKAMEWDEIPQNVVTIYSFTKMFAMAGLRLGYALGPSWLIQGLKSLRNPWSVNHLAQEAGMVCLDEKEYEVSTRDLITQEREKMITKLDNRGFITFPGKANFILVKMEDLYGLNARILWEVFAREGIFIRNAENFKGLSPEYFRIAVRLPDENQRFLATIDRYLNNFFSF